MTTRRFTSAILTTIIVICAGMSVSCWKSDDADIAEDTPTIEDLGPAEDLGRDDMAALPGAEIDTRTLEAFPYHLRQESSLDEDEIFAFYDGFFTERGWSLESSTDPITGGQVHRYQLGEELAFVTVTALDGGLNEVVLARRQVREDESTLAVP